MVALVVVAEAAMFELTGGVFCTVTVTEDVATLPTMSVATAESVYEPLGVVVPVVFHVVVYGDDIIADPIFSFPTLNWTYAIASDDVAVAESVMEAPPTVAPFVGAVSSTFGGVDVPAPVTSTTVSHDPLVPALPVRDKVYSVEVDGETRSEPDTGTVPIVESDAEIASVDDQMRSELSPSVMVGESAVRLHEGVVLTLPPPPKPGETSEIAFGENVGED